MTVDVCVLLEVKGIIQEEGRGEEQCFRKEWIYAVVLDTKDFTWIAPGVSFTNKGYKL